MLPNLGEKPIASARCGNYLQWWPRLSLQANKDGGSEGPKELLLEEKKTKQKNCEQNTYSRATEQLQNILCTRGGCQGGSQLPQIQPTFSDCWAAPDFHQSTFLTLVVKRQLTGRSSGHGESRKYLHQPINPSI